MSGESSQSDHVGQESDEEGGSESETDTLCPPLLTSGGQVANEDMQQSVAANLDFPGEKLMAAGQNAAALAEKVVTLPDERNDQEKLTNNSDEEEASEAPAPVSDLFRAVNGTKDVPVTAIREDMSMDEIQEELGMLVQGCYSVRETMSEYRDKMNGDATGDNSSAGEAIGGDIKHIFVTAVGVGKPEVGAIGAGEFSNEVEAEAIFPGEAGAPVTEAGDVASLRPNSGVSPGAEKKKKGTRLPLPLTPSKGSGGPHQVAASGSHKKLPVLSPLGYTPEALVAAAKPKSASQTRLSPSTSKTTFSPGKKLTPRAQTARGPRPGDSPLGTEALLLLKSPDKRCSGDFSRLLKPTASCTAKYTVSSPNRSRSASTRASPSKSLGDTRLRLSSSSYMMGDVGNGPGSPSASPTPEVAAAGTGGGGGEPAGGAGLKEQFTAFSRFGDATSDGKQITLSNADKWMKQAHVVDGKKITTTDTSIAFKKLFKTAKKVGFDDFKRYVEDLSKSKGMEGKDVLDKLANCGAPGLSQATKAAHAGVVSRLTDTSKYTGSHKERFDATGKGRGIEGRRDVKDNSGYVAAFKAKQDTPSPTAK